MPIPVICKCAAKLRVGDHLRGQRIQCPKCGQIHPIDQVAEHVLAESGLSEADEIVEKELEKGESLLWAGKPQIRSPIIQAWIGTFSLLFGNVVIAVIWVLIAMRMPN